ncbi:MAG: hypothetical protein IKC94_03525 [Lentisphaeria bacterium]|nr:hypothetical protein [Lentisphaeria bacterium]
MERTFRDSLWLWGQDAGSHHKKEYGWNIPGENKMGPVEGAAYLDISNCFRVVMGGTPAPPFDAESEQLAGFDQVVWSIMGDKSSVRNNDGADDLEEVLRQAAKFPNVTGGVLDDFFSPETADARITLPRMREIRDRLHSAPRPLELFLVYYAALFDIDYTPYLELADVITFWSWDSAQLARAGENLDKIIAMTPGKKHFAGCYLYNYGDCRELTDDEMLFQLELYCRLWKEKQIDGVVVCSNNLVDTGIRAVEIFREFMQTHA